MSFKETYVGLVSIEIKRVGSKMGHQPKQAIEAFNISKASFLKKVIWNLELQLCQLVEIYIRAFMGMADRVKRCNEVAFSNE